MNGKSIEKLKNAIGFGFKGMGVFFDSQGSLYQLHNGQLKQATSFYHNAKILVSKIIMC